MPTGLAILLILLHIINIQIKTLLEGRSFHAGFKEAQTLHREQQPSEEIPQALPTLLSFLLSLFLALIPGALKNRFDIGSKPVPALQRETGHKRLFHVPATSTPL